MLLNAVLLAVILYYIFKATLHLVQAMREDALAPAYEKVPAPEERIPPRVKRPGLEIEDARWVDL